MTTRHTAERLMQDHLLFSPFERAESCRPWSATESQDPGAPLLRTWDHMSGSIPDKDGRMLARNSRMRLQTQEARKSSLETHIHHATWKPTPYISFTTSAGSVSELAATRSHRPGRGTQTLTVVDPGLRIRKKLPVLNIAAEMDFYHIENPYGRGNQYYTDHYICLWEVTPEEIVGHWDWNDLTINDCWYEEIIMPAFLRFRKNKDLSNAQRASPASESAFNTSVFLAGLLPETLHPTIDKQFDRPVPSIFSTHGSDKNGYLYSYTCSDSDDDVQEENQNDDIIKMMTGDW